MNQLRKRQRMHVGWRLGLSVLLSVGLGGLLAAPAAADWVQVGSAGFSAGTVYTPSLALDSADRPYVAYTDEANSDKASVMRFDGTNWVQVGSAGFSAGAAWYPSLALDSADRPFVGRHMIPVWPWTARIGPLWRIRMGPTATKRA